MPLTANDGVPTAKELVAKSKPGFNMNMQLASAMPKTWRIGELTRESEEEDLNKQFEVDREYAAARLEICRNNMQSLHEDRMAAIKTFYDDRQAIEESRRRERHRVWNAEKLLLCDLLEKRHHDHSQSSRSDTHSYVKHAKELSKKTHPKPVVPVVPKERKVKKEKKEKKVNKEVKKEKGGNDMDLPIS